MTQTATAVAIDSYSAYVYNCLRNRACEPPFSAPLPNIPNLQLYVNFGAFKPAIVQFYIKDLCSLDEEQIFPSNYVVGQTPEGNWYGVFKYFDAPIMPVSTFVVWLSAFVHTSSGLQEVTFFSQSLMIEPCDPLMKVKSCHPEGATTTGFDVNGLYYGLPVNADFLGINEVRYFHILWVRQGKVRELSNKATFVQSLVRNFRSTLEKTFQLETELVPQWFKDMLLAIYMRGAIQINNVKTYLVSELAFEAINDNDLQWKPFVQLKETFRLYFGCDESECVECCSPIVLDAFATFDEESPGLIQDTYRYATDENICSSGTINFLYSGEPFGTGTQMFTDAGLTTPLTGQNFIRQIDDPIIYEIDPVTGIVGAPSGADCTPDPAVVSFRVGQDFNAGQPTNPVEQVTVYVSTNGGANWTAIGSVLPSQVFPYALVPATWNTVIGQGFLFGVLKTTNGQNVNNGVAGSTAFAQCGLVSNPQNQTVTGASQTFSIWIDWNASGVITTC